MFRKKYQQLLNSKMSNRLPWFNSQLLITAKKDNIKFQ